MDFELSEEQCAFQKMAQQFAADRLAPHVEEWDEKKIFPVNALHDVRGGKI